MSLASGDRRTGGRPPLRGCPRALPQPPKALSRRRRCSAVLDVLRRSSIPVGIGRVLTPAVRGLDRATRALGLADRPLQPDALTGTEDGTLPDRFFLDLLRRGFAEERAQQQLDTAIDWGRYGEMHYDADKGALIQEPPVRTGSA